MLAEELPENDCPPVRVKILSERLVAEGHDVQGIDAFTDYYARDQKERNLQNLRQSSRFRLVEGDVGERAEAGVAPGVLARAGQAVAGVGLLGPALTLENGTPVAPVQATGDYAAGCEFAEVSGCIPGHGCGAPGVYLLGGGSTNRSTPAGTPLW